MEETKNLDQLLNSYLSDEKDDKVNNARFILKDISSKFTDEQVEVILTDFEYLADQWLDEFERELLDGKTIIEISK